jgi:gluconolactonase
VALGSVLTLATIVGFGCGQSPSQAQAPAGPAAARGAQAAAPATDTVAPNIPGVVAGGTPVQVIGQGFRGTEGPIGMPDGSLIFTETDINQITRIDANGRTSVFLQNTNGSNGLAWDARGRLISVQTVPGKMQVGVLYPQGSEAVLVDSYDGKPFARPNDLVVDKKGGVYFTDAGINPNQNPPPPPQPLAVYYITPEGRTVRVAEGIARPNGVMLSQDERILYVNDSNGEYLLAFDVQPDGTLRNRRNFARYQGVMRTNERLTSGADGLAIDSEGRVYACTQVGIQVFSAQGQYLGLIPLSRGPQNLAFAGPDKKTLYVVGRGAAFKVQMLAQGFQGRAK